MRDHLPEYLAEFFGTAIMMTVGIGAIALMWGAGSPMRAVEMPVFAYGREAPNCFDQRRYLATIILATAQIEIILNKDSRMRRAGGGWRTLNMKLLRDAAGKGLPVQCLLAPGESLKAASIEFVELRNRLAHGNLAGMIGFEHNGTPDYSVEARETALAQMRKAESFVMEWYNSAPDVQERRIVHHRWPNNGY